MMGKKSIGIGEYILGKYVESNPNFKLVGIKIMYKLIVMLKFCLKTIHNLYIPQKISLKVPFIILYIF